MTLNRSHAAQLTRPNSAGNGAVSKANFAVKLAGVLLPARLEHLAIP
jgi:hypothetical protein